MTYSKACFLSYKMRYHLNLKLLTLGQEVTEKKYMFFKAAILSRKKDEYRNNFYTIDINQFDTLIQKIGSGEAEKFII